MEKRIADLNKRLRSDGIASLIFAGIFFLLSCMQILNFFIQNDSIFLKRGVQSLIMAIPLLLIYFIIRRTGATGKPFDDKNIRDLRIISIIVIIGGILPMAVESFVGVIIYDSVSVEIELFDLFIPLTGVIIGIISEIFVYGRDLQEDNDLIA